MLSNEEISHGYEEIKKDRQCYWCNKQVSEEEEFYAPILESPKEESASCVKALFHEKCYEELLKHG